MVALKCGNKKSLLSEYTLNLGNALARHNVAMAEKAKLAEAERTSKITSQFIANMSHELRTPLNSIVGFSDLLSKIDDPRHKNIDPKEYGQLINQSAHQLLAIINEILDISRIQSDQYILDPVDIYMDEILGECIAMLKQQAEMKKISLDCTVEEDMAKLCLDPTKMRQIFTNIINNAIKFTPEEGAITILAHQLNEDQVQVSIADTGIGMTTEEIDLALTPFGQIVGDLSRNHQGTGLGLPIAKALVELHQGSIEISSEKNKGSIFNLVFPVRPDITI